MKTKLFSAIMMIALCIVGCTPAKLGDRGKGISCNPNVYNTNKSGGIFKVEIRSTSAWSATTNNSWVSISPTSGQGDAFVTISVPQGNYDTAKVIFSNGKGTAALTIIRGIPIGALSGVFSVSETKRIKFSRGNLQYQAITGIWRFAENQYDIIGMDNENISSTYSGWIDLFGWGTGNNPTNTTMDYTDYPTFCDWGVNAISNGDSSPDIWRTLSYDEWRYLFLTRNHANSLRGQATVCGLHGYVLLPDNWKKPYGLSFVASSGVGTNVYSSDVWATMEDAGAVFLPFAGYRYEENPVNIGSYGSYWSSSADDESSAINLIFTEFGSGRDCWNFRSYGRSVRLVYDDL